MLYCFKFFVLFPNDKICNAHTHTHTQWQSCITTFWFVFQFLFFVVAVACLLAMLKTHLNIYNTNDVNILPFPFLPTKHRTTQQKHNKCA